MIITLREPYWSAYKKYGWDYGVEGYGVNIKKVREARDTGEPIDIKYKSLVYTVSIKKLLKFYEESPIKPLFKTKRGNVTLVQIPRTLMKVKKES